MGFSFLHNGSNDQKNFEANLLDYVSQGIFLEIPVVVVVMEVTIKNLQLYITISKGGLLGNF